MADDALPGERPCLSAIIHNHWEEIVSTVGADHIIPNLHRILNADEKQEIQNESRFPTRRQRMNYLLDLLEGRSDGLHHLVIALRRLYPQLYSKIVREYVEAVTGRQLTGSSMDGPNRLTSGCGDFLTHLLKDLEERLATCEADLRNEKEAHAATREAEEVTLRERSEAQRDIEEGDMVCQWQELQQQVEYHRSKHADALTARNVALQARDDLLDMLRSKAEEMGKLRRRIQALEGEKRNSWSLAGGDEAFHSQSNTKEMAEIFKQKFVEEQKKVCDLQLQLAGLKDRLRLVKRKYSLLSECGEYNCDSGTFVESYKNIPIDDGLFEDTSSNHLLDIDCSTGFHGIEVAGLVAGLVVVRRIMATPTACCQGQLQEGDIIMKINDVSIERKLSEYANTLMAEETGRLKLQVWRRSSVSRYTSSTSENSVGMMSSYVSKGSSVSAATSVSSYDHKRKQLSLQLPITRGNGMSSSLHSLPEAVLCPATEPQETVRRTSVVKRGGVSMTILKRNSEESPESLSRSLTAIHEASCVSGSQPRLSCSRITRPSQTRLYPSRLSFESSPTTKQKLLSSLDVSCCDFSPHHTSTPDSPISRQQLAGSRQDIQGQEASTNSPSNAVRTVAVVASESSPTVEVVGGYGRGVFVKKVCGDVTEGTLKKGDQILEISSIDFTKVTHAQAVQAVRGSVKVQVVHNRSGYDDVVESNFGIQDSFYVRTLFARKREGTDDIEFESRTIFHVTETFVPDQDNLWLAYPVSSKGKDVAPPKLIPNLETAAEIYRLEVKRNSKATEKPPKQVSTPKQAPAAKRKTGVAVQDRDRPHLGYEFLKACKVTIARPVMLLGILTGRVSDQLLLQPSTTRFVRCRSIMGDINDLASKFHCIVESDPNCIIKLHEKHLHLIIIFVTTKSKRISKSLSLPPGVSRHALEMELEAAESVQQQYGHEFSDEIQVTLSSTVDFSKIAQNVIQMVEDHQENTVWDIDGGVVKM